MSKKDAAVYLRAAERIMNKMNHQCCCAIWAVEEVRNEDSEISQRFTEMFHPDDISEGVNWGHLWGDVLLPYGGQKAHNCRILALCFAAAMAETGDL